MLEVVCAIAGAFGFIMGAVALRLVTLRSDDPDPFRAVEGLAGRIAELETRADANCENVLNQGEILAEHREALDAIAERLPKPRAPRKRKKGTPADAILSVGGEPANDNGSDS